MITSQEMPILEMTLMNSARQFLAYIVEEAHNCDGAFENIHSITKLKTVRVSKSNHVLYAKDNILIKK